MTNNTDLKLCLVQMSRSSPALGMSVGTNVGSSFIRTTNQKVCSEMPKIQILHVEASLKKRAKVDVCMNNKVNTSDNNWSLCHEYHYLFTNRSLLEANWIAEQRTKE